MYILNHKKIFKKNMTNSFENFEEIEKKACQVELPLDVERDVRMPLLVLRESCANWKRR